MRIPAAVALALLFSAPLAGCSNKDSAPLRQGEKPVPVGVTIAGAAMTAQGVRVSGTVRARQEAALAFAVPGRISRIMVNEGDRVAAGQILAGLETVEVDAGLAAARAEVGRADAELARQRELFAKGWVAKARIDAAEATASAARAQLASRGFAQRYAHITAPAAGIVLARSAEPGQIVAAGTPVLSVSQSGGYVLRVSLTDAQLAALRPGQIATVTLPALGTSSLAARFVELGGRGDPRTGAFEAELALPPLPGLRSGMLGEARLPATGGSGALAIPASAVFQARADEAFVYIVDSSGKARSRRITLGRIDQNSIEVLSGISVGEKVISTGLGRVREGTAVQPVAASAAAGHTP